VPPATVSTVSVSHLAPAREQLHTVVLSTARRTRTSLRGRLIRVRGYLWPTAQSAAAAGIAWELAVELLPAPQPVFAPISALVALGFTVGQRGRRAVEIVLGVSVGIAVADLVARVIGVGAIQIALVAGGAMAIAALLSESGTLIVEAGATGILVLTVSHATSGATLGRFLQALVGGSVAMVVSLLLFPLDPAQTVKRAANTVFDELATTLEEAADALARHDPDRARSSLRRARRLDRPLVAFRQALVVGGDAARLSPRRRTRRGLVRRYRAVEPHVELAVLHAHALVLGVQRLTRRDEPASPELALAYHELAGAVRALARRLDDPERERGETRRLALDAAARATTALTPDSSLSTDAVVAQVQSAASALLRATGLGDDESRAAVQQAIDAGPSA
jgi:uncharacterized membrane protein YgaE (UPF0421/DUF939 family)